MDEQNTISAWHLLVHLYAKMRNPDANAMQMIKSFLPCNIHHHARASTSPLSLLLPTPRPTLPLCNRNRRRMPLIPTMLKQLTLTREPLITLQTPMLQLIVI